jgi:hypothetical protein
MALRTAEKLLKVQALFIQWTSNDKKVINFSNVGAETKARGAADELWPPERHAAAGLKEQGAALHRFILVW